MARLLLLALLAVPLLGQDAAAVALLVNEPSVDAAQLAKQLASRDPLTRATAARVVLVRGVTDALPALREVLAAETNAEAAREQVRALALLGTADDVALAAKQLPRFPSSLDSDFARAVLRRGAPSGTALYLQHRPSLRSPDAAVRLALWGRSSLATAAAAQLVGAGDARMLRSLLEEQNFELDAGVLGAALGADSPAIRTEAVWYGVRRYAVETDKVPETAAVAVEGASPEEAFGREVLRRMRGGEPVSRPEWLAWLRTVEGRARVPGGKPVLRHLGLEEQEALKDERLAALPPAPSSEGSRPVGPSPFRLYPSLPTGLGAQLLAATQCKSDWLGTAVATVDRTGRVQTVDATGVQTTPACRTAVETMLRLSLADPSSIDAPLSSPAIQLVRAAGEACFDEGAPGGDPPGLYQTGGDVKPPVVTRRVSPRFAKSATGGPPRQVVILEGIVSRTGCLRTVSVVKGAPAPELNAAALQAVAKWKFDPATLDGRPVDAIFHFSIQFSH
ncbi:MAG TPA: energy transducer TonB [Thermoanaerobaculia bacterium]